MRPVVDEAGETRRPRPAFVVLPGGRSAPSPNDRDATDSPRPERVFAEPWYFTGGRPLGPDLLALRRRWGVRAAIWRLYAR